MVTVKEKTTVTQHVHGACPTHSRTEISVRDVKAVIDEPKEREGLSNCSIRRCAANPLPLAAELCWPHHTTPEFETTAWLAM